MRVRDFYIWLIIFCICKPPAQDNSNLSNSLTVLRMFGFVSASLSKALNWLKTVYPQFAALAGAVTVAILFLFPIFCLAREVFYLKMPSDDNRTDERLIRMVSERVPPNICNMRSLSL